MTNTSATGGYLAPGGSPVAHDGLEDLVRAAVVGITGLDGPKVRPRWQENPAPVPGHDVNWCAVGCQDRRRIGQPVTAHDPEDEGNDIVTQTWRLTYLVTLYGPDAHDLMDRLTLGLGVEQNRAPLRAGGLALVEIGDPVNTPELVNTEWVRREDLELTFDIEKSRTYPVRNLVAARLGIRTDTGQDRALTIKED